MQAVTWNIAWETGSPPSNTARCPARFCGESEIGYSRSSRPRSPRRSPVSSQARTRTLSSGRSLRASRVAGRVAFTSDGRRKIGAAVGGRARRRNASPHLKLKCATRAARWRAWPMRAQPRCRRRSKHTRRRLVAARPLSRALAGTFLAPLLHQGDRPRGDAAREAPGVRIPSGSAPRPAHGRPTVRRTGPPRIGGRNAHGG